MLACMVTPASLLVEAATISIWSALLPLITIIGLRLADVVGGSVIIEYIFQWPGMGRLFLQGIDLRDPSLVMANLLVFGSAVVFASIVADIAYAMADPRIRYEKGANR